ncbi:MAG TPA: hypothetical protein VMG10_14345 [Gemmataceae bacterium]|nr:hypothetical protein [Gemmataceae bacterium]
MAGIVAAAAQFAEEVRQVFGQRPPAVLLEGIDDAGLAQLGFANERGEHLLRGGLVRRQRQATVNAGGIDEGTVPLARQAANALAVLRQLRFTRSVLAVDPARNACPCG